MYLHWWVKENYKKKIIYPKQPPDNTSVCAEIVSAILASEYKATGELYCLFTSFGPLTPLDVPLNCKTKIHKEQ